MGVSLLSGRPASGRHGLLVREADDRWLTEAARHDPDAFATLYRRHVTAVYAHAYRLCGSKEVAEEATSATFERALRAMPTYTWQGGGIRPWLLRIAGTEVAGWYRRQQRSDRPRGQMALRELAWSRADEPGSPTEPLDALVAVRAALPRLPDNYRRVIELRYLAGLDATDAAEALGCSKAALAVTLHRALVALRKAVATPAAPAVPDAPRPHGLTLRQGGLR
jgi:RNA polymerase sigma factor (sigma-70 family)